MKLLYRATRDGFKPTDWHSKVSGHANTLTLVKVHGTNNIFGAYTACKWPVNPVSEVGVKDDSCQSFFFSLINEHRRPLRFRMPRDCRPSRPVLKSNRNFGPLFAEREDGLSAWGLMWQGMEADEKHSCWDRGLEGTDFEVDKDGERGDGFELPKFDAMAPGFLSGSKNKSARVKGMGFSCAEIEVYTVPAAEKLESPLYRLFR
jgi:hypothetical protein